MLKFWLKILAQPEESLLRCCYHMLFSHQSVGRKNWITDFKNVLYRNGFGYVWEKQYVENKEEFIKEFTQRLNDCYIQKWNEMVSETSKLILYKLYKVEFETEQYLLLNIPRRLRKCLAMFRMSFTDLEIEKGRREGIPKEDRLCRHCGNFNINKVEDEFHVLLECKKNLFRTNTCYSVQFC